MLVIGFEPDETKATNLHPPLLGDAVRQSRSNSQLADALERTMNENIEVPTRKNFRNLIGNKFSSLSVTGYGGCKGKPARQWWICKCDCGAVVSIRSDALTCGHSTSCGCYMKKNNGDRARTHGKSHYPEYRVWVGIIRRTLVPSEPNYDRYGGRGITVCDRWRDSFENFISDMGRRPDGRYSINRKDNDGSYSPENCEWTTAEIQAANTRSNRRVTFNGETLHMSEWARRLGLSCATLSYRVKHWTVEQAFTQAPHSYRKNRRA